MIGRAPHAWIDGRRRLRTSLAPEPAAFAEWARAAPAEIHAFPTFSPDGRRLAAFRTALDRSGARLVVASADLVTEAESAGLGSLPIHLSWSPAGDSVAVLSHTDGGLRLQRFDVASSTLGPVLVTGAPCFYAWLDADRLVVHLGDDVGDRLVVVGPGSAVTELPVAPGSFRVPLVVGGEVLCVVRGARGDTLVALSPDTLRSRELELVNGRVTWVGGGGGTVLRAVSHEPEGPFRDLRRLDPATGRSTRVSDVDGIAFLPAGERVVVARQRPRRSAVGWFLISADGREERWLTDLVPGRDLRFWLGFFDQLASPMPLVDAGGTELLLAGTPAGERDAAPHLWSVPLTGGDPRDLGEGLFATFAPR